MGALLPPEHQEESHRQSSAATTKSTLPKQGRDDLEAFSKQTSFLVLMLKNVLNHPALFGPGSQRCQRCIQPLGHGCSAQHWHVKAQRAHIPYHTFGMSYLTTQNSDISACVLVGTPVLSGIHTYNTDPEHILFIH